MHMYHSRNVCTYHLRLNRRLELWPCVCKRIHHHKLVLHIIPRNWIHIGSGAVLLCGLPKPLVRRCSSAVQSQPLRTPKVLLSSVLGLKSSAAPASSFCRCDGEILRIIIPPAVQHGILICSLECSLRKGRFIPSGDEDRFLRLLGRRFQLP